MVQYSNIFLVEWHGWMDCWNDLLHYISFVWTLKM